MCWLILTSFRLLQTTLTPDPAYLFHVCLAYRAHHHQIRLLQALGANSLVHLHATLHADASIAN